MSQEMLIMIYYAYCRSLMSYGIIFWVILLTVFVYSDCKEKKNNY